MRISVTMKKIIIHKINAATPRLSDEELDPLEQDDTEGVTAELIEGYLVWTTDDIADIHKLIEYQLDEKERAILNAFLEGMTYMDLGVTESIGGTTLPRALNLLSGSLGYE